jgi:hypothetical protein
MRRSEPRLTPGWLRFSAIFGLGLLIALVVWWPMLRQYPQTPIEDGHSFFHQIEIARAAWKTYHEMPLWNAFDCKGVPLWDHPENITASPFFYLTLPFSAGIFVIVWHLSHVLIGWIGAWYLCRDDLKLSRIATFIAASAWTFGTVHNQYAGEHMAFVSFYDLPLVLFAWRKAEHSWNWAVGTGLMLAWMIYDGATYPLPLSVVFLGLETLTRCTTWKRALKLGSVGAVVGLVGFACGASRLLPIQDQFGSHVRAFEDDFDSLANAKIWSDMYLLRTPHWRSHLPNQQYVLGEYMAYIGFLGLIIFLIGFAFVATDMTWLVFLMGIMVILMLGHFANWAPWTVLHQHVPPFKSMRVPARFRLLNALPISICMGYAVERFPTVIERIRLSWGRAVRVALVGMAIFSVGDSAGLFTEILEYRFTDPAPPVVSRSTRFYYGGSDLQNDYAAQPRQNHAWLGCRTTWAYSMNAALWAGDVPQARAMDSNVVVEVANRTHNTFTLDVDVKEPSRVLLNSGYDHGWQSTVGTVVSNNEQLAVDLPPGKYQVHLRYWPRRLTLGIWLSVLGLLGSLLFLFRADWLRYLPLRTRS